MPKKGHFLPGPAIGSKIGKLTVIAAGPLVQEGRDRKPTSICKCDCGKTVVMRNYVLRRKGTRSCGCTRKHGHASRSDETTTYKRWCSIKRRCGRHRDYLHVSMCEEWRNSYEQFLSDMGECPEGLTIDRIDPRGNYEPSNCRWVDAKVQQNNKTNNHRITANGLTMNVQQWMDHLGLHPSTFYRRIRLGWSQEEAASIPKYGRRQSQSKGGQR